MKRIYFDPNIFTHIHQRNGVSDADLALLRAAIVDRRIRVPLSTQVLEETICALLRAEAEAVARLELIFDLTSWRSLIKYHTDLIEGDVVCYAFDKPMASAFLPGDLQIKWQILDPTPENRAELVAVAQETQEQIQIYTNDLRTTMTGKILPIASQPGVHASFAEYWEALSVPFAEGLAEEYGLRNECRERGSAGLLAIRSVYLWVYATLSLTYAQTFEGRVPNRGDSRDMHHAVLASAAEVFVTDDRKLVRVLNRVPVPDLEIIELGAFLRTLETRPASNASSSR